MKTSLRQSGLCKKTKKKHAFFEILTIQVDFTLDLTKYICEDKNSNNCMIEKAEKITRLRKVEHLVEPIFQE